MTVRGAVTPLPMSCRSAVSVAPARQAAAEHVQPVAEPDADHVGLEQREAPRLELDSHLGDGLAVEGADDQLDLAEAGGRRPQI